MIIRLHNKFEENKTNDNQARQGEYNMKHFIQPEMKHQNRRRNLFYYEVKLMMIVMWKGMIMWWGDRGPPLHCRLHIWLVVEEDVTYGME